MMIGMMAFWLLLPVAAIWLLSDRAQRDPAARRDGALRILEERFARGEIDAEEFAARRKAIQGGA